MTRLRFLLFVIGSKISLYGGVYIQRGLYTVGNLRYKIDWANSWKANKEIMCHRTVIALFYLVFQGNFQVEAPTGLYSEGRLNRRRVFLRYEFGSLYMEGFIFGILLYLFILTSLQ